MPHCVKCRAESYWHVKKLHNEGDVPTKGIDYMYMHSEQEKEEENGMPIVVAKDNRTKMIMARDVPSKGLDSYAVESVKKMIDREVGIQENHHEERQRASDFSIKGGGEKRD